jgi:hypothetical protein
MSEGLKYAEFRKVAGGRGYKDSIRLRNDENAGSACLL